MDAEELARAYYDAIDAGDYDALSELLAHDFEHVRPDMTLPGREAFVSFMREDRPRTDTRHAVDAVYEGRNGVAVQGRLVGEDGDELFAFVDAFDVEAGDNTGPDGERARIAGLETYANSASTRGSTSSS